MKATQIRSGNIIRHEGVVGVVLEVQHTTPGNKRGFMQVRLKEIPSGTGHSYKISSDKDVERIYLDSRPCQYLYQDGGDHVFMDNETFEQFPLPNDLLEPALPYMVLNSTVSVQYLEGKPVTVELPTSVVLTVTETEEVARGNTANAVTKPATVESGLVVKVPAHVKVGDRLKISTETGEFQERAKE